MTWGNQNTEAEAHEQLSYAFDLGINILDTAEVVREGGALASSATWSEGGGEQANSDCGSDLF